MADIIHLNSLRRTTETVETMAMAFEKVFKEHFKSEPDNVEQFTNLVIMFQAFLSDLSDEERARVKPLCPSVFKS